MVQLWAKLDRHPESADRRHGSSRPRHRKPTPSHACVFATHEAQVKLHDGMLTVKQHDYSTAKGRQICDRLEADYPQQEDSRFRTPPNTRQHGWYPSGA